MGSRWTVAIAVVAVVALVGTIWFLQKGDQEQKIAALPEQTQLEKEASRIQVEVAGRNLEVENLQYGSNGWALFVTGKAAGTDLEEILRQSAQLFQGLDRLDLDYSDIGLVLRTDDLKDVFGNTLKDLPILELGLSGETYNKIDWNAFEPTNFERVADRYWVHDEILRLAAEKAAKEKAGGAGSGGGGSEGGEAAAAEQTANG